MNIQTVTKSVANKSTKPRVWVDILTSLSLLLTILAALPYQLGDVATLIGPEWKARIAITGAIATAILQVIRPYLPSPHAPVPQPEPTADEDPSLPTDPNP